MANGVNPKYPLIHQGLLLQQLQSIFPSVHVQQNSRKQTTLTNAESGSFLEVDLFIPPYNLAFEFQDAHHYVSTWYYHATRTIIQQRDNLKNSLLRLRGKELVGVPCWWDGSEESLAATVLFQRPDLLAHISKKYDAYPVSLNPPLDFFQYEYIPEVGELMLASFPVDMKFDIHASPDTWWMGEKYDGIRFCWHPVLRRVYSRTGKRISIKASLKTNLPNSFVEGELWFGRGNFSLLYALVAGSHDIVNWDFLRFVFFDMPFVDVESKSFEERYALLLCQVRHHSFSIIAPRILCTDNVQLANSIKNIIENEGEGVILRRQGSKYERGRSTSLIKLKTAQEDKEGMVVAVSPTTVTLKIPNGSTFDVPSDDVHITRPRVGDIVTFVYDAHSRREIPSGPKIIRIRTDVEWSDVVRSQMQQEKFLSDRFSVPGTFTSKPVGHWTVANMRNFMEKFAYKKNMDPLLPDTWYKIPYRQIIKSKSARAIMLKLRGGSFRTLQYLFPDVKFDRDQFPLYSWHSVDNRRKFFENFAKRNGFSPLIAENWYEQSRQKILGTKKATSVLSYHKNSVTKALLDLFPDIGLEKSKLHLQFLPRNTGVRRKFFEDYAKENKFNPLVPENWYAQSKGQILTTKGIKKVLGYHNSSISRALLDLFPDIGLEKSKLFPNSLWFNPKLRRKFFEKYAEENNFDPLLPENWYSQPTRKILEAKGIRGVLYHHNNNVTKALYDLFPDIGLDFEKKRQWSENARREVLIEYAKRRSFDPLNAAAWYEQPRQAILEHIYASNSEGLLTHYKDNLSLALLDFFPDIGLDQSELFTGWQSEDKRRKFFEKYATEKGFDPLVPNNWYTVTREQVMAYKGASRVLHYHSNSLVKALVELFPDIGLQQSKFHRLHVWGDMGNQRKFFEKYASLKGFDPLVPDHWYQQSSDDILAVKGANKIISFYGRSIAKTLLTIFPDIGFVPAKLHSQYSAHLTNSKVKFFEEFAKENNFDPYVADAWYTHAHKISYVKGASGVLAIYNGNIAKALIDLFPNIGLDKSLFSNIYVKESKK